MTLTDAKRLLKRTAELGERIRATQDAKEDLSTDWLPEISEVADESIKEMRREVVEVVKTMLKLPPDECRVLIARYVKGTPYAMLARDDLLAGMTQRTAERVLARATERFADEWR